MVEIADGSAKMGDVWNAFRDEVPSFTTLTEKVSYIQKSAVRHGTGKQKLTKKHQIPMDPWAERR